VSLHSFSHTFVPAESSKKPPPILLLHRTGAAETDLIPWAKHLWPGAALLAPRGRVLEDGRPRFFRRYGQAQFDLADLHVQTAELDAFITSARQHYALDAPIAVGHSNGANIAWSLLFSRPAALTAAILLRPLMPIEPAKISAMPGFPILILSGSEDRIASPKAAMALPERLGQAGAEVSHIFLRAKHDLVPEDQEIAHSWLSNHFSSANASEAD
jgi:phospholipase/carboxylesterase